jgi:hypothetical protein
MIFLYGEHAIEEIACSYFPSGASLISCLMLRKGVVSYNTFLPSLVGISFNHIFLDYVTIISFNVASLVI